MPFLEGPMGRGRSKRDKVAPTPAGPQGAPAASAPPPARRITGWRLWVLRATVALAAPAMLFSLAELGLRVAGYGHPTDFFVKCPSTGNYTANERFGWRFFPPAVARAPGPCAFAGRKPPKTYRVFVLGSSAAYGVPDPAYSFGRVLEVMLRQEHPEARFEVINACMTAINSHAIREIAGQCANLDADLLVVYMGNNEVVGPYGPGTVFGGFSPSLAAIRAGLWVKSTCVGQLIGGAAQAATSRRETFKSWQGMQMFMENLVPADDPRLAAVYDHFRANLSDICGLARPSAPRVIVCTVITNLKDCPPLASVHRAGLAGADKARWQEAYDAGAALEEAGEHALAAEKYAAAAAIDDRYADLEFRRGRCAWARAQFDRAREHFIRARDLDALRFRADTRLGEIIREVAAGKEDRGVYLVDAAKTLESDPRTPHGTAGEEWLYEHVHLNFEGNCLLAGEVLRRIESILPGEIRQHAAGAAPPTPPERSAELLALTGWNRYRMMSDMEDMTRKPPFINQIDHARRQAAMRRRVLELKAYASPEALRDAADAYARAIERAPDDLYLRAGAATVAEARGLYASAAEQWRAILKSCPDHASTIVALGVTLMKAGDYEEAIARFKEALRLAPATAAAYKNWGDALVLQKKAAEAAAEYRQAIRLNPDYVDAYNNLAAALVAQGRSEEAQAAFERALAIQPDAIGHYNLALVLAKQGKTAEAVEHLRQAIALASDDAALADRIRRRLNMLESR